MTIDGWLRSGGERRFNRVLCGVIAGSLILAAANSFVQDDAFISFRYAQNLVEGHGLVWNPEERVEGYTNFLWTILIAGGLWSDVYPTDSAVALGLAFFALTLLFECRLGRLLLASPSLVLAAVALLGTNYTFSAYATGGLETQMQTFLFVAAAYLTIGVMLSSSLRPKRLVLLSVTFACAVLTRMDSAIVCAILFAAVGTAIVKLQPEPRGRLRPVLALAVPFALIVCAWLAWKWSYYGSILPNSYHVKVSNAPSPFHGFRYLFAFATSYFLLPFPFLAAFGWKHLRSMWNLEWSLLLVIVLAWLAYVVRVGGDFMEFRFLVPIMPFAALFAALLVQTGLRSRALRIAAVAVVVAGSVHHYTTFEFDYTTRVEPIRMLQGHLVHPNENWIGIGKLLGEAFGRDTSITIATTAAGAIPYYSGLRSVDMLGINDPHVAMTGYKVDFMPGHRRMASLSYLLDRGVDLVVSHPQVLPRAASVKKVVDLLLDLGGELPETKLLEIPIGPEHKIVIRYISDNPAVERAIRQYGWKVNILRLGDVPVIAR